MDLDAAAWTGIASIAVVVGLAAGGWRLLNNSISRVRDELTDYRLHIAEHYVTKRGLTEQTVQIMAAIGGLDDSFKQLNQRIDRLLEKRI